MIEQLRLIQTEPVFFERILKHSQSVFQSFLFLVQCESEYRMMDITCRVTIHFK